MGDVQGIPGIFWESLFVLSESLFVLSDISMLFFQSMDLYKWFFRLVLSFFMWESNCMVLSALLSSLDGSFVGSFNMGRHTSCLCGVCCREK
jgi:hypothetical protein